MHCVAGGEGGEFHPHFAPAVTGGKADAVFFKGAHSSSRSGFEGADEQGTALADWLRARGVEHVDVVGIATDHCVRATALDAAKAGFRAHVRLDYSVGVAPDTTNSTLDDFREAGIRRIRRDARNAIALSRRTTSSSCRARRAEVRGSGRRPCPCGRGRRCPESGRDQAEQGPRSGTGFTPA